MNPVKCPNCRLSLPQNWAGSNDPNAKCPYCGKPLSSQPAAPSAPHASTIVPPPAQPAARPAKTMLWGVGAAIPGPIPNTVSTPQSGSSPTPSAVRESLANSATVNREAIPDPARAASLAPVQPQHSVPDGTDVDMGLDGPSNPVPASPTTQGASKPNQPAATVMFESPNAAAAAFPGKMERSAPEAEPIGSNTTAEVPEPEPPADPSPRPTPTRSKFKSKPLPKKGSKSRPGKPAKWSTAEPVEDSDEPKPSSSKTPIIVVVAVALIALIGASVYFLRGKTGGEPAAKEPAKAEPAPAQVEPTPGEEPAALAAKKPTPAEAIKPVPAEKPAHAEKPTPAEKPTHAERPAHAEKPTVAEKTKAEPKTEPATPETKSANGKPSEEDFRRANEAYERGNAKLFQGNTAEAIAAYDQALKLNPKDPAIHRGLGLAYAQSGQSAEATKHLKLYLKAAPKATDRAIIEKRIDQLRGQ